MLALISHAGRMCLAEVLATKSHAGGNCLVELLSRISHAGRMCLAESPAFKDKSFGEDLFS